MKFLSGRQLARISLGCIGSIFIICFAFGYYFWLLRASSVLGFQQRKPRPLRVYDRFFGHNFAVTDTHIPGSNGPIQMRVYSPIGVRNPAPIVLIHGFASAGNKEPYLNSVAYRLAGIGFVVFLPTIPAETHYEVESSDLTVIGDSIRWIAATTDQKVSVFGISFSGGLVIPAVAKPNISGDVKLVFCISGYNSLDSIARYYIHEPVYDPYGHPYSGNPPGPLVIISPYLDDLVAAPDALDIGSAIYDQNRGVDGSAETADLKRLSPAEQKEFAELRTMKDPHFRQLYLDSLSRHRAEIYALSPASVLKGFPIPLYILHGSHDPVFPEGEVEWMRQELKGSPNAHILVTPWITHAVVDGPANTWQKLQVIRFCAVMFSNAAQREPLASPSAPERASSAPAQPAKTPPPS